MDKVFFIAKKELSSYFKSPTAYIVFVLMVSIFNVFFFLIIDQNREASLRDVFLVMDFMLIFLAPIITMRLFSEEKMSGTIEFLMTSPISNTAIVLGKYIGVLILFSILISITFLYYAILEYFSAPDRMTIFSGYIGVWLEGALFLSIGLMASSWTRNQIVAAMISFAIIFSLYFSANVSSYLSGSAATIIHNISSLAHLESLVSGIVRPSDIIYYLSGILICLVIARLSIENG
ncbi:MAG: ABC-2 type transport system permease protein [Cryomorphaceae bacterium]|jgi:ABC-2 type transport system permease protein